MNLLHVPVVGAAVKSRRFQFSLQFPMVLILILIVFTGLFGIPHPGKNFATIATWTFWWTLIIPLILFTGSLWCTMCPWMAVGNWIQRSRFWNVNPKVEPIADKIPLWLRNRYPALIFFIGITWLELGLFITLNPMLTACLALAMILMAVTTALVFDRNFFCRYVCFVGAIVGLYSNLAPVEVRAVSKSVCRTCGTKDCFRGNGQGYGCPTWEFPASMEKNSNCILCTECLKSCPHDNLALNARPFFKDVAGAPRKTTDEAVFISVLGGLTLFHGVTMIPFWMNHVVGMMGHMPVMYFLIFSAVQAGFVFGSIAVMWGAAKWTAALGAGTTSADPAFRSLSYSLLPVVIMYHLAHNLTHLNEDAPALIPVLSDPFGWGWDLFGTADRPVDPIFGVHGVMMFGALLALIGLGIGMVLSFRVVKKELGPGPFRRCLPTWICYLGFTLFGLFTLLQPMAQRTHMMHHG